MILRHVLKELLVYPKTQMKGKVHTTSVMQYFVKHQNDSAPWLILRSLGRKWCINIQCLYQAKRSKTSITP